MDTSSFCSATLETLAWEHVVLVTDGCDTGDTRCDPMMQKHDLFFNAGMSMCADLGNMWDWPLMM